MRLTGKRVMQWCLAIFVACATTGAMYHPINESMRAVATAAGFVFIVGAAVWLVGVVRTRHTSDHIVRRS